MSRPTPIRVVAALAALSMAAAAHAAPKDDVKAAAQKLADAKSYSFTQTVEGGQGGGGGSGKVERGGYTSVELTMRDNTIKAVRKGDRAAVETDDGWQSADDMKDAQGPQRYVAAMMRTYKTPAEQVDQILADATEVKKSDGGQYTADLPEPAAKKLIVMGRGGRRGNGNGNGNNSNSNTGNGTGNGGNGGTGDNGTGNGGTGNGNGNTGNGNNGNGNGNGPSVANAKATVTFTLTDGSLSKVAVHLSGTVTVNGNDRQVDRTTTTEIRDVDKTTADVPLEAKAKLDAAPAATTKP